MAVITPVRVSTPNDVDLEVWKWIGLASADTALPVLANYKQDKSIMWIAATPGGTPTVNLVGSNDPAGSSFATLHDTRGFASPLTLTLATTATIAQILEATYLIKPLMTGSVGTVGADFWLLMRGR